MDIPEFTDSELVCRILAIDNGTDKVGFTIADYHMRNDVLDVIHCETFKVPNNYRNARARIFQNRGSLLARLDMIMDHFEYLLEEYEPHIIGCESPFGHRMMHAFRTLTISMEMFDDVAYHKCPFVDFVKITPIEAKKAAIGDVGKFTVKKDQVHKLMLKNKRLTSRVDLLSCGEDGLDSVTVAMATAGFVLL